MSAEIGSSNNENSPSFGPSDAGAVFIFGDVPTCAAE